MIPTYSITDFPSAKSIGNQFMLEQFEKLTRPKNLQWPHKHSFYEIQWLTAGTATNVIDYHQITIQPDSLFFISPGQLHLMSKTDGIKGHSLTFTEEFLLKHMVSPNALLELSFLDNSYAAPFLKLTKQAAKELIPMLSLLCNEVSRKEKSEVIVGHLLVALLNHIQRIVTAEQSKGHDTAGVIKFKEFKKLVEENFKTESSLIFYSEKLFLSIHRINEICKKITGRAAGEVIRDRILLETKRMLLHSDTNIGEISEDLGFKDFSYFSRQFKKMEGMTPAEYRRTMYEKYQMS